jgi:hypothetical protein
MQVLDEALLGLPFCSSSSLLFLYVSAFSRASPLLPSALFSFYFLSVFSSLCYLFFFLLRIPTPRLLSSAFYRLFSRKANPYLPRALIFMWR